jgi:hypothetical protein
MATQQRLMRPGSRSPRRGERSASDLLHKERWPSRATLGVLSLLGERGPGRVPDPPFATTGTAPSWNLILSVLGTTF